MLIILPILISITIENSILTFYLTFFIFFFILLFVNRYNLSKFTKNIQFIQDVIYDIRLSYYKLFKIYMRLSRKSYQHIVFMKVRNYIINSIVKC
jgi:hypothetical protein